MTTQATMQSLTTLLYDKFPDMKGKSISYISEWYDNHVLLVDDTYIFRIARDRTHDFSKEIKLLQMLSQYISTRTPEPTYIGSDYSCMWYVAIPGIQLSSEVIDRCTISQKERLGQEIAQFIKELHTIPTQEPQWYEHLPYHNKTEKFMQTLSQIPQGDFDSIARDCYASVLSKAKKNTQNNIRSIVHHDLYSNNIFVNAETMSLSWIIDFSDVCIGDIHEEFVFLLFEYPRLGQTIIREYQQQSKQPLDYAIIHHYASIFALHEYVHKNPDNYKQATWWLHNYTNIV